MDGWAAVSPSRPLGPSLRPPFEVQNVVWHCGIVACCLSSHGDESQLASGLPGTGLQVEWRRGAASCVSVFVCLLDAVKPTAELLGQVYVL